jgi:hypothetical protein
MHELAGRIGLHNFTLDRLGAVRVAVDHG